MKYLLYILLCTIVHGNNIWLKIQQFFVKDSVYNFLDNHQINNCFYKFQDEDTLLLKCLRNNKLVDVSINIEENYNKRIVTNKFI
jgi:hypothetical protein